MSPKMVDKKMALYFLTQTLKAHEINIDCNLVLQNIFSVSKSVYC